MKALDKQLREYYHSVWVGLSYPGKMKKKLLERLKEQVANYLEENPDADLEMIQNRFGTPQQIAAAALEELPTPEVLQKLRIRKKLITIVGIAVLVAVLLWLGAVIVAMIHHFIAANGYITISPVDIR